MSVLLFAIEVRVFHVISKEINVKLQYTLSSSAHVGYRGFVKFKWILAYKKFNKKKTLVEGAQTNYVSSQSVISMCLRYSFT